MESGYLFDKHMDLKEVEECSDVDDDDDVDDDVDVDDDDNIDVDDDDDWFKVIGVIESGADEEEHLFIVYSLNQTIHTH
ncbi:unnamed protein product [Brugia timori]|uniref:Uncharacterized protein n=1 Tax=Brugia timori TaxID=42155 RepID=A0A0R3QPI0_9BILA|nr:unnamed protein product [Brugia timori]